MGYLYLTGTSAGRTETPDSAALSITGDIDIRFEVALDAYVTDNSAPYLGAKMANGVTKREWYAQIFTSTDPFMRFTTSPDGTSTNKIEVTSSAALPVSDGQYVQLRYTLDVDNGAADSDYDFYYKFDGDSESDSGWTQLGTTQNGGGVTSIFDADSPVELSTIFDGVTAGMPGKYYRFIIKDGIGGTTALDQDMRNLTTAEVNAGSFTATTGQTVTIAGASWSYAWDTQNMMMQGLG